MAIVNNYSWASFKSLMGTPKYAKGLINSETGEEFTALAFEHPTKRDANNKPALCFVSFSQKLGVLTPSQLASQVSELQIVENEQGRYTLCHKGEGTGGWEVLDF